MRRRVGVSSQVEKQLVKLVEVISVENLSNGKFVERWLSLIKVKATLDNRPHILQIVDVFRCRVVDMGSDALTIEVTGDEGKMRACTEALRPYGILEVAGSGSVALSRAGFGNGEEYRRDDAAGKYDMGYLMAGNNEAVVRNAI